MENLVFSLNSTMPVFFMILIGFFFRKIGWISESFASQMNRFVFRCSLPVMIFRQLATTDIVSAWDTKFVLFCFGATLLSIVIGYLLSRVVCTRSERGEFIQASYRSSAAILGIAYITNIYGNAGMAPLMIIGSVPLYNIAAVVVLEITTPREERESQDPEERKARRKQLTLQTVRGIVTNGIVIGIVLGMIWSLLRIPMPSMANSILNDIGKTATPLGLLSMGAAIDPSKVTGKLRTSLIAAFLKLAGYAVIFLPAAVFMGFRTEKLVAILVMLTSPTTIAGYVMAKNMGHEGTVSSNTVVIATFISSFTMTFWIWLLRTAGLI